MSDQNIQEHEDYRLFNEQAEYEYFKSKDYSKEKKWSVLFSTHESFCKAVRDMNHSFHKEALQIWKNRREKDSMSLGFGSNGEEAYQTYRLLG